MYTVFVKRPYAAEDTPTDMKIIEATTFGSASPSSFIVTFTGMSLEDADMYVHTKFEVFPP